MAKGMQQNKMVKKPKKDTSPPKEFSSDRPTAPVTTVPLRGKMKNKSAGPPPRQATGRQRHPTIILIAWCARPLDANGLFNASICHLHSPLTASVLGIPLQRQSGF